MMKTTVKARLPLEPCLARFCLAAARLRCVRAAAAVGAMACGEEPYVRAGPPEVREAAADTTRAVVQTLIDEKLKLQEAKRLELQVTEEELDEIIPKLDRAMQEAQKLKPLLKVKNFFGNMFSKG